jgi:hypothetical protein
MDKTRALIAALAFAAGTGAGTALSQPEKPEVKIVNLKLVRSDLPDGGAQWTGRACAYEKTKAGVTEPCWSAPVASGMVAPIEQLLLDGRK